VVKVTKYLTDMRDMDGMVEVLSEYFGDWKPASTTICINSLSTPGARVELDMIAVRRWADHAAARDPRRSRRRRLRQPAGRFRCWRCVTSARLFPACARSTT
jgi:hypothetical protein